MGAHGLDGAVRIVPESDNPDRYQPGASVWVAGASHVLERVQYTKDALLVMLSGISADDAHSMADEPVLVRESAVPPPAEGTYYHFQLIDLHVRTVEGEALGRLTEVLDTGANDVYVVTGDGQELLVPAVASVIQEINLERNEMVVAVPEGLEPRSTTPAPKRPRKPSKRRPQA